MSPTGLVGLANTRYNMDAKILIVDDRPENLRVLSALLQNAGYTVMPAPSGKLALETVHNNPPDLVLLDVNMPGMDGYEVCAKLKSIPNIAKTPIIFISAHNDTDIKIKAFTEGGVDFITKPFQAEEVLARIEIHLSLRYTEANLERRLRERTAELMESEEKYRRLVETIREDYFFYTRTVDGDVQYVSPSIATVLGYLRGEFLGPIEKTMKASRVNASFLNSLANTPPAEGRQAEIEMLDKSGGEHWLEVIETPHYDKSGALVAIEGIVHDISERKRLERLLYQKAFYDDITGLPNRVLVFDRLKQTIARHGTPHQNFAFVFLDVDRFKWVNETMGHFAGDTLVQRIGSRLTDTVDSKNTVARMGGDEFGLILENLDTNDNASGICEDIIESFKAPFTLKGKKVFLTPSMGVALFPSHGDSPEELIRHADLAMYESKAAGGNQYRLFQPAMSSQVHMRSDIEYRLRNALERGDLSVNYQGIVEADTQKLAAIEALLRWKDEELGQVSPMNFIPVAEESGMIFEIGRWVLLQACAQAMKWSAKGFTNFFICVNVSGHQLTDANFAATVKQVLEETGLPAGRLELEITESVFVESIPNVIANLDEFRELGVGISVDDFGTGYSALASFRKLKPTALKIDRSFIHDLLIDEDDASLVKSILDLANALQLSVIAEGVESEAQLNTLKELHCPLIQGFLFSKPSEATVFESIWFNTQ